MARLSFRYTLDNNRFTMKQRIFYEKNGYLVFPGLIEQDVLDKCHKRFDDIVEDRAPRDRIIVMRDVKDRKSVNKLQDINFDPVFCEYIEHKKILDIVECFTGPNIMAKHSMLIAKPPDIGFGTSKHPPHQDLYYFPFRPTDRIVAAWTAMELCDKQNGCLYVAPGSHRSGQLYVHNYPPGVSNKFYHGIQDLPKNIHYLDLEMQPGDTVFFHPLLIHGSGVNVSTRTRRAISCHYAAVECFNEKDPVQSPIEDEIMEYAKKKYPNISLTYTDVWDFKSSLVRGIQSSL
ncbi:phytanoyl-CoA dioxygenase, peroxisomal [Harpegnathos saltator]|uniref:phytanoyl-CoA dioxygenase n=1 Tax=Harpegnathos saltator TaxID=610380 RepID=E2BFT4_HARSA|nr:phytanoyl-CoA dioxygenase, peroxisomal [Harpegnathos saltator]XP_025161121.1 phytanoyl-CoA dioxygenase, peroxisomal [Harpegnathos saltator]EFN85472.1 Phytanoyl-CoA dioxygenase, peroxisomal [Harpegnathos saltator]